MNWSLPPREPKSARGTGDPQGDGPDRAPSRAVVVGLLALAVVGAALAGPWQPDTPRTVPEPRTEQPGQPPDHLEEQANPLLDRLDDLPDPPVDLGWLWTVGVVLGTLLVGVLVMQMLRRRRRDGVPEAPVEGAPGDGVLDLEEIEPVHLRRAVDDAVVRLHAEPAPTDAIVAAWVALEDAAGRSGVPRGPADTPTEFTLAVLARARADARAARTLLALYLRARFSDEPLGRDDVVAAREALDVIAADLAPSPARGGPAASPGPTRRPGPSARPQDRP